MFIAVAAFLALQLSVDPIIESGPKISRAQSVVEVERLRDRKLASLDRANRDLQLTGGEVGVAVETGVNAALKGERAEVENSARRRIDWLRARDAALAAGQAPPPEPALEHGVQFGEHPWDADKNPIAIAWLPQFANGWLNALAARMQINLVKVHANPRLLFDTFLQTLPQTLFVLLPVFAVLLKLVYLFKRRLYMEHLIVALHSHAFLCLALLAEVGLAALRDWSGAGFFDAASQILRIALALWIPLYLLLMQKRVYAQGWPMTALKFSVLGVLYLALISIGVVLNLLVNLVSLGS
jgi:hypothetical protein